MNFCKIPIGCFNFGNLTVAIITVSAVFRNFFKGGGARLRFQEIRGGKPSWM